LTTSELTTDVAAQVDQLLGSEQGMKTASASE